jgi:hypothetical protein
LFELVDVVNRRRKLKYKIGNNVEVKYRSYAFNRMLNGFLLKMKSKKNKRFGSHFAIYRKEKDVDVFLGYPFFFGGSYKRFRFAGSNMGRKRKVSRLTEARL